MNDYDHVRELRIGRDVDVVVSTLRQIAETDPAAAARIAGEIQARLSEFVVAPAPVTPRPRLADDRSA